MNKVKKSAIKTLSNTFRGMLDREMPSTMAFTLVEILRYLDKLSEEIEEEVHQVALEFGEATEDPGTILFTDKEAQKAFSEKKKALSEELVELDCPKIVVGDLQEVRLTPSEAMVLEIFL